MTRELALSYDKKQLVSLLLNAQLLHQDQPIVHIHHELPLINLINIFSKITKILRKLNKKFRFFSFTKIDNLMIESK